MEAEVTSLGLLGLGIWPVIRTCCALALLIAARHLGDDNADISVKFGGITITIKRKR